jgi:hypothetical protein
MAIARAVVAESRCGVAEVKEAAAALELVEHMTWGLSSVHAIRRTCSDD